MRCTVQQGSVSKIVAEIEDCLGGFHFYGCQYVIEFFSRIGGAAAGDDAAQAFESVFEIVDHLNVRKFVHNGGSLQAKMLAEGSGQQDGWRIVACDDA